MSLVFLTPAAALVAAVAALPVAALALAERRVREGRVALRLSAPPPTRLIGRVAALTAVVALLGVAAAEPAVRIHSTARVRTDAQAMFVVDVSRSMAAARSPGGRTRLARAKTEAIAIRDALPEIPSGVATMTDRVLPNLLPSSDASVFTDTLREAVALEQPPPADQNVTATTLAALRVLATGNYFRATARHRLVVVLTDGESRPFDMQAVARALAQARGERLVLVHVWSPGEAIYDGRQQEEGYNENPASRETLAELASATAGVAVAEGNLRRAISAARADLGAGPTIVADRSDQTRTLAPYVALAALVPLLLLWGGRRRSGEWRMRRASLASEHLERRPSG